MGIVQTPDRLASINEKRPALNCCSHSQGQRKFTRANDLHSSGGRHKHARHQACALQWRDHLPVRDSQTERSEVFIEVPAIYTGQTFFMSHHLTKTDCATFILKDTQCAGLCREDCEINGDAFAANGIFQKNMSVYQTVASRLRCAGENRPIRLCGCRKREKEKDTVKTHELYGPPVLDAGCRLRMLPAAMLYHRISAAASRSEEHTSEIQSQSNLVCRLLLEKKKRNSKALRLIRLSLWLLNTWLFHSCVMYGVLLPVYT